MSSFGARLKQARLNCGLTQEQLGLELDASKQAISSWENDRDFPLRKHLEPLRATLGVDLDYLICDSVAKARNASKNLGVREAAAGYAGGGEQWLSPREARVISAFRAMTPERQDALFVLLRTAHDAGSSRAAPPAKSDRRRPEKANG
jgi:transcriptional regulator with XRE-family HTH domain